MPPHLKEAAWDSGYLDNAVARPKPVGILHLPEDAEMAMLGATLMFVGYSRREVITSVDEHGRDMILLFCGPVELLRDEENQR